MEDPKLQSIVVRLPEVIIPQVGISNGRGFWMASYAGLSFEPPITPEIHPITGETRLARAVTKVFRGSEAGDDGAVVSVFSEQAAGCSSTMSHAFVTRFVKKVMNFEGDFEVFRIHGMISANAEDLKTGEGGQIVWFSTNDPKNKIYTRYGFEHISGPALTSPYSAILAIMSKKSEIWAESKTDLVPERAQYAKSAPFLSHPGCYNLEFGPAAAMEEIIKKRERREKPQLVN